MDFEADAAPLTVTGSLLSTLTFWMRCIREQTAIVERKELELAQARDVLNRLTLVDVPEAMKEAGLTELKMADGSTLIVKKDIKVSVTVANRPAAYRWLREHGAGPTIQQTLEVDLRPLEPAERDALLHSLSSDFHADSIVREEIHPSTLKSVVRGLLEAGHTVPPCISVFEFEQARIKEKK